MNDKRITDLIENIQAVYGVSLRERFISPELPSTSIMGSMVNTAMNYHNPLYDLWIIGKNLQCSNLDYDIPFKTEYECAAGLWWLIFNKDI